MKVVEKQDLTIKKTVENKSNRYTTLDRIRKERTHGI